MLRRLAVQYKAASASGRDDDLWAVQTAAQDAWRSGTDHGDLALLLVQLHLDSHAVSAAATQLAAAPVAAATPTGRMLSAGVALQAGDPAGAGNILLGLVADDPAGWRSLALLAAVYEELGNSGMADLLYAQAAQQLDAKQLATLAWMECQRAGLRLDRTDLDRADQHLRRAEQAHAGWPVAAVRGRWQTAAGQLAAAAHTWTQVAAATGRPDHAQSAAHCWARLGRVDDSRAWHRRAAARFDAARARWPFRYAHHEVDWHLAAGHSEEALRIAEADYAERPTGRQAARLGRVLRAVGQPQRAEALAVDHERRRRLACSELAGQILVLNQAARGA